MHSKTILTPPGVNRFFHLLLLPGIIIFLYANSADAKSCVQSHSEMFFRQPPLALQQRCDKVWTRLNNRMMEQMAQNERFYMITK